MKTVKFGESGPKINITGSSYAFLKIKGISAGTVATTVSNENKEKYITNDATTTREKEKFYEPHRTCSIRFCTPLTRKSYGRNLTWHMFPKDEDSRNAWTKFVRLNNKDEKWSPTKASNLCSLHFDSSCFLKYSTKTRLSRGSVPSKFEHGRDVDKTKKIEEFKETRMSSLEMEIKSENKTNSSICFENTKPVTNEDGWRRKKANNHNNQACSLNSCSTATRKLYNESLSWHNLPCHPSLRNEWLQFIRKSNNDDEWNPTKSSFVCSLHFESICLKRNHSRTSLVPGSVPSLPALSCDDDSNRSVTATVEEEKVMSPCKPEVNFPDETNMDVSFEIVDHDENKSRNEENPQKIFQYYNRHVCSVSSCKRKTRKYCSEKLSWHRFPVHQNLRNEWIQFVRQSNCDYKWVPAKTSWLCSLHFDIKCFKRKDSGTQLESESVPSFLAFYYEDSKNRPFVKKVKHEKITCKLEMNYPSETESSNYFESGDITTAVEKNEHILGLEIPLPNQELHWQEHFTPSNKRKTPHSDIRLEFH